MKTKLLLILLLITCLIRAQDNYMSLSFGIGVPLGDFSKTESLTENGYAIVGFAADYSGAYYPFKYLGIGGTFKFNQYNVEQSAAQEDLTIVLPPEAVNAITRFNAGFWSDVSIAAGPQFTLPVGIFQFDLFAFPGAHIVSYPKLEVTSVVNNEAYFVESTSNYLRFGFETGFNIRIKISPSTGLRFYTSYIQTRAKGEIVGGSKEDNGFTNTVNFKNNIQVLNAGFGLVYKL